jgi:parallel beta-helix repeat protein
MQAILFLVVPFLVLPSVASANMLFVDRNNTSCNNSGAGSQIVPFCTIGAAADQVSAGDIVSVKPGTYDEEVVITKSGSSGATITFVADPGVTVSGQHNGFDIAGVSWLTVRGFNITQTASHAIKAILCSNLTLADNQIVGAGDRGIYIRESSDITVDNNTIQDSAQYGLYIKSVTGGTIANNEVTGSGQPVLGLTRKGIYVNASSNLLIEKNISAFNSDTGIYLTSGTTGVHIKGNILHDNAKGYTRSANGINLRNSTNNTIEGNVTYNNEDSGIQFYPGSHNNLGINNLSYNNGDHGLDTYSATGNRWIGNTVYGNFTSGINVEGGSTGTTIMNNVSVDNGINSTRKKGNINVDDDSAAGSVADYNLIYLSLPGVLYVWNDNKYETLEELHVDFPNIEINGIEADPLWNVSDFHLSVFSPAVDSANSGANGALSIDINGAVRYDEPVVPNNGIGPRDYDDRGAFEFQGTPPGNVPPVITNGPIATPNTLFSNETSVISIVANDSDGDPLAYAWSVPLNSGNIQGTGSMVTYVPPVVIQPQTYTISVEVTDSFAGLATGSVDVVVNPAPVITLSPVADSYVEQRFPDATHGSEDRIRIDAHFPQTAYLRFDLTGLAGVVQSAILELKVKNESNTGGTIHSVSDNSWDENTLTFNNRPVIDGPALDTLGPVVKNEIIQMDVTQAISGGGVYSFAIVSDSSNGVQYQSREGSTGIPTLIINMGSGS